MASEPLVQACEVAFEVARRGWEANPPVEPPAPMRSFIYLPQLPRRAMTVAQRVMDEDPEFRSRVAAAATEVRVGRAGYLWLHRPPGWETTFGMLTGGSPTVAPPPPAAPTNVGAGVGAGGQAPPPPPPPVPRTSAAVSPVPRPQPAPPAPSSQRPPSGGETIESELATLRSLVGRLADERENLTGNTGPTAGGAGPAGAPAPVLPGRDASQQLHRDLENRVVTLEAQLRAATSQLEERSVEDQNTASSLAAAESELIGQRASVDRLEVETASLRSEIQALGAERDEARADAVSYQREHAAVVADSETAERRLQTLTLEVRELSTARDAALTEAAALRDQQAQQQERLNAVDRGRADLEAELADVSSKWQRLQAGASDLIQRNAALEADIDQLRRIRESAEVERRGLLSDLAMQLGRVEAERDLLASQLELANSRLRGTRQAFESATRAVNDELDSCEGAFGQTERAAEAVHTAVSEAGRRLDLLADVIEPAMAPTSEGPAFAQVTMVGERGDEFDPFDVAAVDTVVGDDEASDLADVLASYGLGAGQLEDIEQADLVPPANEPDTVEPAVFEPVVFEPVVFEPAVFEPAVFEQAVFEQAVFGSSPAPSTPGPTDLGSASASAPASEVESPDTVTTPRAQVSVIAGDPLTVARHTVTTAEVVLLIDGDPVAAMGWPMLGPVERRDALVGNLGDLVGDTGAAADVVFDGNVAGDEQLPSAPAVRVRLTSSEVDPSNAISGLLDAYPLQWPIAVVTDDPHLAQAARDLGASVLDNGQLLDLFITP